MPTSQKNEVSKTMDCIEDILQPYWQAYPDFKTLQERMNALRELLGQTGEANEKADNMGQALVVQTKVVEDLMKKYQVRMPFPTKAKCHKQVLLFKFDVTAYFMNLKSMHLRPIVFDVCSTKLIVINHYLVDLHGRCTVSTYTNNK